MCVVNSNTKSRCSFRTHSLPLPSPRRAMFVYVASSPPPPLKCNASTPLARHANECVEGGKSLFLPLSLCCSQHLYSAAANRAVECQLAALECVCVASVSDCIWPKQQPPPLSVHLSVALSPSQHSSFTHTRSLFCARHSVLRF